MELILHKGLQTVSPKENKDLQNYLFGREFISLGRESLCFFRLLHEEDPRRVGLGNMKANLFPH